MPKRLTRAGLAAALVLVIAAVTQAYVIYVPIYVPPAQSGDYSRIHTIGVISAVGSELQLHRFNALFDTTDRTRDIRDWKLDEQVSALARQYLAQRFTMVDIPLDPKTVTDAVTPTIFRGETGPLRSFLKGLNRSDVDAFLVFRPYSVSDDVSGLSLNLSKDQTTKYSTNYEIQLVDAHSFEVVAEATARLHAPGDADYFPELTLPRGFPTDDKLTLNDDAIAILKRSFTAMLRLTEIDTLRELEFGVTLPRPGNRIVAPWPPGKAPLPGVKSVAVVSALDDTMTLTYRGTLFRHSLGTTPVADWKLNAEMEKLMGAALDKRFAVKEVAVDRAKLAGLSIPMERASLDKPVEALAPSQEVDAYILLLPFKAKVGVSAMFGEMDDAAGPGLWHRGLADSTLTDVFMNYSVVVVNAQTLKPVRMQFGEDGSALLRPRAERPVAEAAWPEKGNFTPDQAKLAHDGLTALMADSIPETFMRLGLTGAREVPMAQAAAEAGTPAPAPPAPLAAPIRVMLPPPHPSTQTP